MHIEMDDDLVARIDQVAGRRGRSRFVREAVISALDRRRRAELVRTARGALSPDGHDWDEDPAQWVRDQRHHDPRRTA